MTTSYIKMKIRAGGGALGQQGAPPCYSSLLETLDTIKIIKVSYYTFLKVFYKGCCHVNTQITTPTSGSF